MYATLGIASRFNKHTLGIAAKMVGALVAIILFWDIRCCIPLHPVIRSDLSPQMLCSLCECGSGERLGRSPSFSGLLGAAESDFVPGFSTGLPWNMLLALSPFVIRKVQERQGCNYTVYMLWVLKMFCKPAVPASCSFDGASNSHLSEAFKVKMAPGPWPLLSALIRFLVCQLVWSPPHLRRSLQLSVAVL